MKRQQRALSVDLNGNFSPLLDQTEWQLNINKNSFRNCFIVSWDEKPSQQNYIWRIQIITQQSVNNTSKLITLWLFTIGSSSVTINIYQLIYDKLVYFSSAQVRLDQTTLHIITYCIFWIYTILLNYINSE